VRLLSGSHIFKHIRKARCCVIYFNFMAIYYHEKQNFLYDSITKEYMELRTEKHERSEYVPYPNNEDVGSYNFFVETRTKIVKVEKMSLNILLVWNKAVKITGQKMSEILTEWRKKVGSTEVFDGSSAADDIGSIRAREISGY
jgi:hypothetical protein